MEKEFVKENINKFEENLDKIANLTKAKFTRTMSREDTALIIIDIQDRLAPAMDKERETLAKNKVLIQMAQELDIPVIVTEQYPKGLGNTVKDLSDYFDQSIKIFDKVTFSAYETEGIKNYIEELNRYNFIVTGMETHICVYQTARDLLLKGYNVYIPLDAVASRTEENKLNGLELMKDYGAKISNTETILFDLLGRAGTEQFKKLSPLIK